MENLYQFIVYAIAIMVVLGLFFRSRYVDKKNYNGGVCPRCGNKLVNDDMDSQGGRRYFCDKCGYFTWIDWHFDK